MNSKVIHGFIFILLLSLSAHAVHASLVHDTETCEVCIHTQNNDDWIDDCSNSYLVFDTALADQFNGDNHHSVNHNLFATDLIRGPPKFT